MRRVEAAKGLKAVDPVAYRNRLLETCAAYLNPPTFKPGDLLTHNPVLYAPDYETVVRAHGGHPLVVVLETFHSYRELCDGSEVKPDMGPPCQAILIAQMDPDRHMVATWVAAWNFKLAPPELLQDFSGATNLNH